MKLTTTPTQAMKSQTIITVGTINNVGGTYWAIFLNGRRARTLTGRTSFATKEEAITASRGVIYYC